MIRTPFNKFQQAQISDKRLLALQVIASVQPPDQAIDAPSMELYDIRTATFPYDQGCLWLDVYADEARSDRIGWAQFSGTKDACRCENIFVEMPYRRTGLATMMYDLAEEIFNVGAVPTDNLSGDAQQFWKSRERELK